MTRWIEPVTLTGRTVTLEPLARSHRDGLVSAAADGLLDQLWVTSVPGPDAIDGWFATAFAQRDGQGALPFVVRLAADGRIVGATRYFNVVAENRRLEIGHTWYARQVQRTAVNTECKLLLLTHAFETLGCHGVEFRTHFLNHASRRAIERLGAKLDGVRRSHIVLPDGSLRDTCVFSILSHEWPAVRNNLRYKLAHPAGPDRV